MVDAVDKFGLWTAGVSFVLGTLLFLLFFFYPMTGTLAVCGIYTIIAAVVNLWIMEFIL